jgi:[ribosomal protein S5]-alanine N-acetyltransferase
MVDPVILRTERLLLRPYRVEDLDDLLTYAQDERWSRFLPVPQPYTRADGERWIALCISDDPEANLRWAIEHGGRMSGGIELHLDAGNQSSAVGYSIAPALWGRGLIVEAATAVLDHAFIDLGLERVFATADAENRQSWRVMEKLGMQREGYHRSERILRGERRDWVYYGILRGEWRARQTQKAPH